LTSGTPRAAWALAVVVAGLVGVSRLYLGAHWLTDVLAGFALGAAWLFALLAATRTVRALRGEAGEDRHLTPSRPHPPGKLPPEQADPVDPVQPGRRDRGRG
jgi:undecaprenyl-diphosphatase